MAFQPTHTDFALSPYTGLTRESWVEAGRYLLEGIFQHIKNFEDPVVMPRKETEITYPHLKAPADRQDAERRAEMFEGLTRSLFIAAPLIHNDPELTICGYKLSDYYKNQILRTCTKTDPIWVGTYEKLQEITSYADPFCTYQQTVETCALVICLWIARDEIWMRYTREQKDIIAGFLSSFAHANTVPQNWRLFNMLDLAFLHMEGYPIDREIMMDHAQAIMNYYVGDGWYRDGHSFDYYSCWAFNVYAPLWNRWYGYENAPDIAAVFEANSNKLMETYADFFDQDGFTNMWGRSNIYRFAATSAFDGNMFLNNSTANPGLARRVASGSLLQFLTREDFLYNGIPTLGFYGQFSPLVQGYSCAESPFWLGKAFLCLHLPAEHPFWSAKEENGTWDRLGAHEVKQTSLNGPALCFTNHKDNGETILRTGKVVKSKNDIHGMWNYSKLCFNTKYPWESTPVFDESKAGIAAGEAESQQYVLKDLTTGDRQLANVTLWCGEKDGILYRRQFFNYNLETESHWIPAMNLADFPVSSGIIRVDRHRLFRRPVQFTLGAYGFPDNGTTVEERTMGSAKAVILKGRDATGREKQLAMTIYDGWKELALIKSTGTNPDSEKSVIVYAKTNFTKQYGSKEPYVMISQVITRESMEDFTEEELFPIAKVTYEDIQQTGGYGNVILTLKNKETRIINYDHMDGQMML